VTESDHSKSHRVDFSTDEGKARFQEMLRVRAEQEADDIEFAKTARAIIAEGPWEHHPAQDVAYVGINLAGERVLLPAISSFWRFGPDKSGRMVRKPGGVIVRRVYLGIPLPGMLVGRPSGQMPVQAHGLIDGHEYYFRSRGEHWSMSIGGSQIYADPDWYYEEPYGTWPEAGTITEEQAYDFIAKAAAKFRAGFPTTTDRTTDRATASILQVIGALTQGETKA
jgi:hypothetical protein